LTLRVAKCILILLITRFNGPLRMPKIPSEFLEQGVDDLLAATKHITDITAAVGNNAPAEIIAEKIGKARNMTHGEKYLSGKSTPTSIDGSRTKVERL
jgi:hypothetical protein